MTSPRVRTEVDGLELQVKDNFLEIYECGELVVSVGIGFHTAERITELFKLKDAPCCNFFDRVLKLATESCKRVATT
jgi:hypothetical protein